MENSVIKVLNRRHGLKVLNYFDLQGIDTANFWGNCTEESNGIAIYYGVINGKFSNYTLEEVKAYNAKIIELPKEENSFPRVMLVSDDAVVWYQAVVECLRVGYAFATIKYSSVEEYEDALKRGDAVPFYLWKHIKEISDRNKVTKSEIAEKFGIPIDQLVIKDD